MKIVKKYNLLNVGNFYHSKDFEVISNEIEIAISKVSWGDTNKFVINPVKKENGVNPIKNNFISHLESCGWLSEQRIKLVEGVRPGPIDVIKETKSGRIAVEWETGNISSSHRALNKLAVGLMQDQIVCGILVLPVKNLAQYLTDRIGNLEELYPYFPLYSSLRISDGFIQVISIEHDETSSKVDFIPKGKDGNSKKNKAF